MSTRLALPFSKSLRLSVLFASAFFIEQAYAINLGRIAEILAKAGSETPNAGAFGRIVKSLDNAPDAAVKRLDGVQSVPKPTDEILAHLGLPKQQLDDVVAIVDGLDKIPKKRLLAILDASGDLFAKAEPEKIAKIADVVEKAGPETIYLLRFASATDEALDATIEGFLRHGEKFSKFTRESKPNATIALRQMDELSPAQLDEVLNNPTKYFDADGKPITKAFDDLRAKLPAPQAKMPGTSRNSQWVLPVAKGGFWGGLLLFFGVGTAHVLSKNWPLAAVLVSSFLLWIFWPLFFPVLLFALKLLVRVIPIHRLRVWVNKERPKPIASAAPSRQELKLGLLGANRVGKTTFIVMLTQKLGMLKEGASLEPVSQEDRVKLAGMTSEVVECLPTVEDKRVRLQLWWPFTRHRGGIQSVVGKMEKELVLTDFPGEWALADEGEENRAKLRDRLHDVDGLFVIVDPTAQAQSLNVQKQSIESMFQVKDGIALGSGFRRALAVLITKRDLLTEPFIASLNTSEDPDALKRVERMNELRCKSSLTTLESRELGEWIFDHLFPGKRSQWKLKLDDERSKWPLVDRLKEALGAVRRAPLAFFSVSALGPEVGSLVQRHLAEVAEWKNAGERTPKPTVQLPLNEAPSAGIDLCLPFDWMFNEIPAGRLSQAKASPWLLRRFFERLRVWMAYADTPAIRRDFAWGLSSFVLFVVIVLLAAYGIDKIGIKQQQQAALALFDDASAGASSKDLVARLEYVQQLPSTPMRDSIADLDRLVRSGLELESLEQQIERESKPAERSRLANMWLDKHGDLTTSNGEPEVQEKIRRYRDHLARNAKTVADRLADATIDLATVDIKQARSNPGARADMDVYEQAKRQVKDVEKRIRRAMDTTKLDLSAASDRLEKEVREIENEQIVAAFEDARRAANESPEPRIESETEVQAAIRILRAFEAQFPQLDSWPAEVQRDFKTNLLSFLQRDWSETEKRYKEFDAQGDALNNITDANAELDQFIVRARGYSDLIALAENRKQELVPRRVESAISNSKSAATPSEMLETLEKVKRYVRDLNPSDSRHQELFKEWHYRMTDAQVAMGHYRAALETLSSYEQGAKHMDATKRRETVAKWWNKVKEDARRISDNPSTTISEIDRIGRDADAIHAFLKDLSDDDQEKLQTFRNMGIPEARLRRQVEDIKISDQSPIEKLRRLLDAIAGGGDLAKARFAGDREALLAEAIQSAHQSPDQVNNLRELKGHLSKEPSKSLHEQWVESLNAVPDDHVREAITLLEEYARDASTASDETFVEKARGSLWQKYANASFDDLVKRLKHQDIERQEFWREVVRLRNELSRTNNTNKAWQEGLSEKINSGLADDLAYVEDTIDKLAKAERYTEAIAAVEALNADLGILAKEGEVPERLASLRRDAVSRQADSIIRRVSDAKSFTTSKEYATLFKNLDHVLNGGDKTLPDVKRGQLQQAKSDLETKWKKWAYDVDLRQAFNYRNFVELKKAIDRYLSPADGLPVPSDTNRRAVEAIKREWFDAIEAGHSRNYKIVGMYIDGVPDYRDVWQLLGRDYDPRIEFCVKHNGRTISTVFGDDNVGGSVVVEIDHWLKSGELVFPYSAGDEIKVSIWDDGVNKPGKCMGEKAFKGTYAIYDALLDDPIELKDNIQVDDAQLRNTPINIRIKLESPRSVPTLPSYQGD